MSRGTLDTGVLIATDVTPIPGELAISVISVAGLQFGVLAAPEHARAARLTRLSAGQRRFDPLPVDTCPSTMPSPTATPCSPHASSLADDSPAPASWTC